MIEVKNLSKRFGDFTAVDGISMSIGVVSSKESPAGITALLGPNGAGKTTTMRLLTGYLRSDDGSITIDGLSLGDEDSLVEIKRRIGYLPETSPVYPEMLVSEFIEFMGRARGLDGRLLEERARQMCSMLHLETHFYTPMGLLSKGYRQRAALAGTLIHDPPVIILDEPTSGLDPNQISEIRSLLSELGKTRTVILSTHILQEVEDICTRAIIISRGRIVADESVESLRGNTMAYYVLARDPNGRDEDIIKKARGLQIIQSCKFVREEHNTPESYRGLHCILKENKPEILFSSLCDSGLAVREMSPASRSLQEVFRDLTN